MRLYIRGPHLGPVRTTLWSSRDDGSGKGCLILMLPFLLIVTAASWWHVMTTSWPFDLVIGCLLALMLLGRHVERKARAQARSAAAASVRGDAAEPQAKYSNRR